MMSARQGVAHALLQELQGRLTQLVHRLKEVEQQQSDITAAQVCFAASMQSADGIYAAIHNLSLMV